MNAEQQTEPDERPAYAGFDEDDHAPCCDRHGSRFAEGVFVGAALVWLVLVLVAAVVLL